MAKVRDAGHEIGLHGYTHEFVSQLSLEQESAERKAITMEHLHPGAVLTGIVVGSGIAFAVVEGTSVAYGLAWALDKVTTVGDLHTPQDGHVVLHAVVPESYGQIQPPIHLGAAADGYFAQGEGQIEQEGIEDIRAGAIRLPATR